MLDVKTVFETSRLVAYEWSPDFAEPAFEIYGDPEVTRFIQGAGVESVEMMRERIGCILEKYQSYAQGMGSFPVFLKSTGTMVGTALIKPLPINDHQLSQDIEIGWHLARRQWGRGYATEFSKKLIELGFERLGLDELHAVVDPPNEKSKKVAVRLGMKYQGITHDYYDGKPLDHYLLTAKKYRSTLSA